MLTSILLSLVGLIVALILLLAFKDLSWYLNTLKYAKQGIAVRYMPIIGFAGFINTPDDENDLKNFHNLFKKKSNPEETEPIIAINGLTTEPLFYLNDKELVKEYYKVETKVSVHKDLIGFSFEKSFLFTGGAKGLRDRSTFAEMFYPEHPQEADRLPERDRSETSGQD